MAKTLPPRTLDTMSEAIAIASPSGRISKAAFNRASKRLSVALFGEGGLQLSEPKQPTEAERLEREADTLERLAKGGMKPRAYLKKAEELREQARTLRSTGQ